MAKIEDKLKRAIESTELAEVLQVATNLDEDPEPTVKKVVVQYRVLRENTQRWISVIDFLLQEEEEQDDDEEPWALHLCKTFLRADGQIGTVWNITLSSRLNIKGGINDISRAIRSLAVTLKNMPDTPIGSNGPKAAVQRATRAVAAGQVANQDRQPKLVGVGAYVEVEEMPLIGVTPSRGQLSEKGKGASFISEGRK